MFFNDPNDDDDEDFTPASTPSSRLSSLFGGKSDKPSNLKYVAPKQPRADSTDSVDSTKAKSTGTASPSQQSTPQAPTVLIAARVHVYLYVNGAAQSQGRAMCCIVGNCVEKNFQLLIYRSKQDHLTRARIHQHFVFTVQPNNYGSFTDDQQRNWSIMLEGAQYVEFVTQIGVCRALAGLGMGGGGAQVIQDVTAGEGPSLREGDQTQVVVSMWSVMNGKKNQEIEEPKAGHRIKLKDVAGTWEGGVMGAQKNTRRFIFVHQAKGGDGLLMYDVTVERVKLRGGDQSGRSTPHVDTQQAQREEKNSIGSGSLEHLPQDPGGQVKDDVGSSTKASLVSRMARVGQPLLPSRPATSRSLATDSESEVEEISRRKNTRRHSDSMSGSMEELEATPAVRSRAPSTRSDSRRPEPAPRPAHLSAHPQQLVVYQSSPWQQQTMVAPPGYSPMAAAAPVAPQVTPPASDPTLSLLFSETRSQNTELKISVSKMSDKIDCLVGKIEKLEQQQGSGSAFQSAVVPSRMAPYYQDQFAHNSALGVDPHGLLTHITTIVSDNDEMKTRLGDKETAIASLNASVTQLLQKNQKLLEEKTDMLIAKQQEAGTSISLSEVLSLREEKSSITAQLSITQQQLKSLQDELSQSQRSVETQRNEIQGLKSHIQVEERRRAEQNTAQQQELVKEVDELREELKTLRGENDNVKSRLTAAEGSKQTLRQELSVTTEGKTSAEEQLCDARVEAERLKGLVQVAEATVKSLKQQELAKDKEHSSGQEDVLHTQAAQIKELKQEIQQLQNSCSELEKQRSQNNSELEVQVQKLIAEKILLEETVHRMKNSSSSPQQVVDTVKKVMNTVFRTLKPQFTGDEMYPGAEVLRIMLGVIRDTTLQIVEELLKKESTANNSTADNSTVDNSTVDNSTANNSTVDNSTASQDKMNSETTITSGTKEQTIKYNQKNTNSLSDDVKISCVGEDNPNLNKGPSEGVGMREGEAGVENEGKSTPGMNSGEGVCVGGGGGEKSFSEAESKGEGSQCISQSTEPILVNSCPQMLVSNFDINNDEELDPPSRLGTQQEESEAAGGIQVKENEEEPVKSTEGKDKDHKVPVIDMDNTEVRMKGPEKSDSSRDSSMEREWRPRPPTPPLFSDEDDDNDDWLS
ncbi:FK506-binding protein 15-like isoform X2 [Homarus americanus]|uniref:FK506-binding protein 15-like isoform X2 n=1 Tax=Homarus americanus TaxID=6706 RepID=UPI001C47C0E4|nr:FK506-binding protein 15-like isoform X2 [Homarus americanus]